MQKREERRDEGDLGFFWEYEKDKEEEEKKGEFFLEERAWREGGDVLEREKRELWENFWLIFWTRFRRKL